MSELVKNEELVNSIKGEINTYYDRFANQREKVDELNKIADYMYACAQNRTIESQEKVKGMNMDQDTRANMGSSIYHRAINQLSANLEAVLLSKPDLFIYKTFSADGDVASEGGEDRAKMMNLLAKWTIKKDGFTERLPQFTRMLFKRSNIFAHIIQNRVEKEITVKVPEFETITDDAGEEHVRITGEKDESYTKIVENHPSIVFPPPSQIYLDSYIGNMQQQPCVIIISLKTKAELYDGVRNEYYDEEVFEDIGGSDKWDGEKSVEALRDAEEAREGTVTAEIHEDLYLTWDVYLNISMTENEDLDEEGKETPTRYWITLVGNEISDAKCLRFERNPEPDDEIPLKDIHVYPDDGNRMYHTTTAEIARSTYSADCTLLGLTLDNSGLLNDPPKMVLDGQHAITDFEYKKGAIWNVFDQNAVKLFAPPAIQQDTIALRNHVQESFMMAMSVDKGFMGQSQGARTSASEATFINRNSMQPHLSQTRYILMQLLPWMGKKYMKYWQEYGDPSQVMMITDENKKYHRVKPADVHGEYEVDIEIIDEYESDALKLQSLENIVNIVANHEWLHRSMEEEIDGVALFKELVKAMKIDPSKFTRSISYSDAEKQARNDIERMLYMGEEVPVDPNSDLHSHMKIKEAELSKWKGVENDAIGEGVRVDILQAHVAQLKGMIQQGGMGGPAEGGGAPLPEEEAVGAPTEGQLQGDAMSAIQQGGM